MVIKCSLGGESAGGNRSASGMTKCSADVSSDLGNGSFWIKIRDAKLVAQYWCWATSSMAVIKLHPRRLLTRTLMFFILRKLFDFYHIFYQGDQTISSSSWRIIQVNIGKHPYAAWNLTSEMVPFGSKSVMKHVDQCTCSCRSARSTVVPFDCTNWPLTSREFYFFFGNACNGLASPKCERRLAC